MYTVCMPRLTVYLSDAQHARMRELGISPSEALQDAIRAAEAKTRFQATVDEYLAELDEELGDATTEEVAAAAAFSTQLLFPGEAP